MRACLGVLVVLSLAGCGAASSSTSIATRGPHDPCDGAELDLGEAAQSCRIEGEPGAPPSADVVRVAIATASLASGAEGAIQLAFTNTGSEPVELDFPGTLRFEASLFDGEGRRVDERWEVGGLASSAVRCRDGADCRTVRVRLAGGGTLIASIPFAARVEVVRAGAGGALERSDGGAIAPGSYGARVMLPWMDAVAGSATGARTTRIVEGTIAISP